MKHWLLSSVVALLVGLPAADALEGLVAVLGHGGATHWLQVGADGLQAGVTLAVGLAILSLFDDPPSRPMWLLDWRCLVRRHRILG